MHASNVALILGPLLLPGKRSELGPNIYYQGLGPIVSVDRLGKLVEFPLAREIGLEK